MRIQFPDTKIYCIDMGVLIKLDSEFSFNKKAFKAVWVDLEAMINNGELVSCEFLEEEANRYLGQHTFIKEWVAKHKSKFLVPNNTEILVAATQVINENLNTGFLNKKKWESGQNQADPYLIALGRVMGCAIITTESKDKPNRIPQVAEKYGVRSADLYEFFDERGLEMKKKE